MISESEEVQEREWSRQHFYRHFTMFDEDEVDSLCSLLGWKIFTIDLDGTMHFSHEYVSKERLSHFLKGIQTIHLKNLILNYNHLPNAISLLSHVHFSNLIVLQLSGNKISSIESLQKIRTGMLKILLLEDNHITSIKVLAKTDLSSLQTLSLSNNCISQLTQNLIRVNSPLLTRVEARENHCRSDGLNLIVKAQSRQLKIIDQSHSRIILPSSIKISKVILQRYPLFERFNFS